MAQPDAILCGEGRRQRVVVAFGKADPEASLHWDLLTDADIRSDYASTSTAETPAAGFPGEDLKVSAHLRVLDGFRLYKSTNPAFTPDDGNLLVDESTLVPGTINYTDLAVVAGQTYYYILAVIVSGVAQ